VEEDEEDACLPIYTYQPKEFFKLMPEKGLFLQCNATLGIPLLERIFFPPPLGVAKTALLGARD
jgi:hypothetical protein